MKPGVGLLLALVPLFLNASIARAQQPPVPLSVLPTSGAGASQTFTFTFAEATGAQNLAFVAVTFGDSSTTVGQCFLYFNPSPYNRLYLMNDAGTAWTASYVLGAAATLANSQCRVNVAASSASAANDTLTLRLAVVFEPTLAGPVGVHMYAANRAGAASGWHNNKGSWLVPALSRAAPSPRLVTPNGGMGSTARFSFLFRDDNGFEEIDFVGVIFGAAVRRDRTCFVRYNVKSNVLYLMNDAGTAWAGSQRLGVSSRLENSQCSIDTGASSPAFGFEYSVGFSLAVNFKPAYAGSKTTYMYAADTTGEASGWQARGSWTSLVTAATVARVEPSSGRGLGTRFNFEFTDYNGAGDIGYVGGLIATQRTNSGACFIRYNPRVNILYLMNDAGNAWVGSGAVGSPGVLQNGQCSIDLSRSAASASGTNLTLALDVAFLPGLAGTQNVYALAADSAGRATPWQQMGTYTVGLVNHVPQAVSVTPNSGSNARRDFVFLMEDGDSGRDINSADIVIGPAATTAASTCVLWYVAASNTVSLLNDAGNAWVGSQVLGSVGQLENSQCSVDVSASSSSAGGPGNSHSVRLALTFKPAFAGTWNMYLRAWDNANATSGHQLIGVWAVP